MVDNRSIELAKRLLESKGYIVEKIEESDNLTKLANPYMMMKKQYKNMKIFKDRYKESGELRDFIEDLEHKNIPYDTYEDSTDNGVTVFYN